MKKNKTKSLSNILEPLWSSRDSLTKSLMPRTSSIKKKGKGDRKKSNDISNESDYNGSDFQINVLSKSKALRCDNSASDSCTPELPVLSRPPHNEQRGSPSHVTKCSSLEYMLTESRCPGNKSPTSVGSFSRPNRPSSLSLKASVANTTSAYTKSTSQQNKWSYGELNNFYSCDIINSQMDSSERDTNMDASGSILYNESALSFTTLEVGPILHLPCSNSNKTKQQSKQFKDSDAFYTQVQQMPRKMSTSPHESDMPRKMSTSPLESDQSLCDQSEMVTTPAFVNKDIESKRLLTHKEKRKALRASKSLDIDSQEDITTNLKRPTRQDIDSTDRLIEKRDQYISSQNWSHSNVIEPNHSTPVNFFLPRNKSSMIVSQSYDDILKLEKSTEAMEKYSNTEKDYLKVPQRGLSVDYSLLGSDLKQNRMKQRFRTYSNNYTTDEEIESIYSNESIGFNYCPSANEFSSQSSSKSSKQPSRLQRSQTLNARVVRKTSFAISPSKESPPSNPFTFNMSSKRSPPPKSRSKSSLQASKSFDFDDTLASSSSSPPRTKADYYTRTCQSAESKPDTDSKLTRKPPRSPVSFPRYLSHASEAVSPACETCSPHSNRIFNRLARRFSLRRKSSREKSRKGGSVDDLLKFSFGVGEMSRKSLESDTSMGSYTGNTTDSDISSLHDIEHESLYRGVLRCLLHPLGCPGSEIGLRPGDLLDHVRTVFDVPHPDHAYYIREELQNSPTKVQASVTLLEAKSLTLSEDHGGVYCLLTQVISSKLTTGGNTKSPKNSPRGSPKTSPRSSPKFIKSSPSRSPSLEYEPLRSHTCPNTHDPKWNECFHIDIDDPSIDEITIFVCYYDRSTSSMDSNKQPEKGKALKAFFRNILQAGNDNDKNIPGCFGRVDLPIREIPMEGCDKWFNILPIGSWNRHKPLGQLRLQIAVSSKHTTMNNYFCAEDYHQASLLEHKHAAADIMDADGLDLSLSPQAQKVLNIFAVANGISKLSQKIMNLTVFLELVFSRYSHTVTDSVLHRAMEDVQMTWCEMQVRGGGDFLQKMPLCDAEICLYRSATRRYIDAIIDKLDEMPVLFPPSMDTIHNLKAHFGIGLHLLELDVWDAMTSPQRDLASALVNKLQRDVRVWVDTNLDSIHTHQNPVKDAVIPEVEELVNVTNALISILSPLGVVEQFFLGLDVKYYRIVYFETERKLSLKVRELMMNLDKYQTRYHSYRVNLNRSCRLSIKLFLAVRSIYDTIKVVFDERDLFRLSIPLYQDWFQEAVVFWLQMFRTECTSRIQKALEIDKDLVLVTSQLKYSNSSVDAQACFSEITHEWRQIDIKDADTAVMGVTKIVDMICDGARVYASKIQTILERNCYYDSNQTQFDVTERMCITLNNIEHVRMYLSELPELLDIEDVTKQMGIKHEDPGIGHKSLDTLRRLILHADSDILLMSAGILRKVCRKMSVEVKNNMDKFLVKTPEQSTATDKVIGYLNTNLKTLMLRLSETIFPHMASQLWMMVVQLFDEHVLVGKPPDYYGHMQQHLRSLTMFFCGWCPNQSDPFINFNTPLLEALRERLEISSWKTERLMREYLHNLSSHMTTPLDYLGHLAVKTAYMEETRGNVTIYVKVIQGIDLPGLDSTGLSDPYVIVSVQPWEIFGQPDQRTKVIEQTLQPVFNTTFMFPNIPRECLSERGNCLLLSVMDQDVVTLDDFAGEVVISLDSIHPITMNESVDIAPALLMPLRRPEIEADGPFKVLQERVSWDKSAKKFIKSRMRYIENQPERTDHNVRERLSGMFKFWSKSPSASKNQASVT